MNLNQDHNTLKKEIDEWNKNRIDLFEISIPNKDLEYFGVVRFYHQSNNTSTHSKCIRISSSWSTENIIHVLMEKFRPDMKMLSNEKHCLYEVHSNGDERMLQQDDKPLKVQLMWGRQDRDGRFIFKREKEINGSTFKRKLSKREKKQLKKQEKKDKLSSELPTKSSIAETHFSDIPDTNLHRTISNPETLVKRRRQTKIERILKNLNNLAMDSIAIKTKIYIGIQNYKGGIGSVTININPTDSTVVIIKKTLIALGLEPQDYFNYLLMKSLKVSRSKVKIIVDVADRPIGDMVNWSNENGKSHSQTTLSNLKNVKFTLKGATPALLMEMERFHDSVPSLENKFKSHNTIILLEIKLNPKYDVRKSDIKNAFISFGKAIELGCGKHSIGSSRKSDTNILNENRDNLILLDGSDIEKYHAKIIVTEDSVQVEPVLRNCLMYIKSNLVTERSLLKDGDIVCIGTNALFKVYDSRDQTIKSIAFLTAMMTQYQQKLYHSNGNASDKSSMSILSKPSLIENGSQHEHNIENVVHDAPQKYKYRKISKLPLILEFNHPDELISSVVWSINTQTVPFKHGPAYIFYLACRQFIENESLYVEELASFVHKICMAFSGIVEKSVNSSVNLAFWIANISEFLHFIKYDVDICRVVPTKLVLKLSQILETSFYHLIDQLQLKTEPSMLDFMDQSDADLSNGQYVENPNLLDGLLHLFSSTMPMLRRCRINAALAIQLFSQLFYFVNMWLFNKLVQCDPNYPLRCNRVWGSRLRRRIEKIEIWAEKQGLELAADCHLGLIIQTCNLLQAKKSSDEEISGIAASSFRINSQQMKSLLYMYEPLPREAKITQQNVNKLINCARRNADQSILSENRKIQLLEPKRLPLPFILPNDGYSSASLKGTPGVMMHFVHPFIQEGIFKISENSNSSGYWNVNLVLTKNEDLTIMENSKPVNQEMMQREQINNDREMNHKNNENENKFNNITSNVPETNGNGLHLKDSNNYYITIKKVNNRLGLSIVSAKGPNTQQRGIYIKSVVPGETAALDGRLREGDQLLEVDGISLINASQEDAATLMKETSTCVTLKVMKNAAEIHGLVESIRNSSFKPNYNIPRSNLSHERAVRTMERTSPRTTQPKFDSKPNSNYKDSESADFNTFSRKSSNSTNVNESILYSRKEDQGKIQSLNRIHFKERFDDIPIHVESNFNEKRKFNVDLPPNEKSIHKIPLKYKTKTTANNHIPISHWKNPTIQKEYREYQDVNHDYNNPNYDLKPEKVVPLESHPDIMYSNFQNSEMFKGDNVPVEKPVLMNDIKDCYSENIDRNDVYYNEPKEHDLQAVIRSDTFKIENYESEPNERNHENRSNSTNQVNGSVVKSKNLKISLIEKERIFRDNYIDRDEGPKEFNKVDTISLKKTPESLIYSNFDQSDNKRVYDEFKPNQMSNITTQHYVDDEIENQHCNNFENRINAIKNSNTLQHFEISEKIKLTQEKNETKAFCFEDLPISRPKIEPTRNNVPKFNIHVHGNERQVHQMVPLNLQSNRNVKKNLIDKPKKMNSIENFNRESNLPIINSFSKPHSLQNQEKSKLSSTNLKVIDDVNGTNEYKMEMKPLQINNQNERLNFYKSFENQQPNLDSKPFYANGYNSKASSTDSDIGNRVKINSHGNNHLNREYNSIDSISKSINEPTYTDSNSNLRFKKLSNEELTEKLNDRVNETTQSGVVGTNEIYNDPRERIIAQRKFKIDDKIKSTTLDYPYERMSFGDKVKLFNNSNATKNILAYPKSSRAQRVIEKNYD